MLEADVAWPGPWILLRQPQLRSKLEERGREREEEHCKVQSTTNSLTRSHPGHQESRQAQAQVQISHGVGMKDI